MTWFKVDDSFHSHPKVMAAGPAALGLWLIAGTWSCANLTDGFVPDYVLPRLAADAEELARTLVAVGLWRRAKGGHRFHDWDIYQRSREEVLDERRKWAEKKAEQRATKKAKGGKSRSDAKVSPGDTPGDSPGGVPRESSSSRSRSRTSPNGEVKKASPSSSAIADRADVERVCAHLADRITANGNRKPAVGAKWLNAARLLIDRDGITEEQIHAAIDWCQNDEFWRGNILSMPKLRQQFDQLRQAARRTSRSGAPPSRSTTDERVAQAQALKSELGLGDPPPLNLIQGELA